MTVGKKEAIPDLEYDPLANTKRAGRDVSYRPRPQRRTNKRNPAEQAIIAAISKNKGRPLTPEETALALAQAKAIHGDDLTGLEWS
jgi:hypothetical protein